MDKINVHVELSDKLLHEFVESGNFKQALKHSDKRVKKSPNDHKLLISRASIYFQSGELEQCLRICKDLTSVDPPIVQLEILRNLFFILTSLQGIGCKVTQQDAAKSWQQAIQRQTLPKSRLDLAYKWLECVVTYNRWDYLDLAAAAVQQHSDPKDETATRKAYFLRVLSTALSLQATAAEDAKEQVLARLALMRIVQSAKLSEQFSQSATASGVRITTTSELSLAIKILQQWERYPEISQILHQQSTGATSNLAANQPDFMRSFIEALKKTDHLQGLGSMLVRILSDQERVSDLQLDDYFLWHALIECENRLNNDKISVNVQDAFDNMREADKRLRAPRKARLALLDTQTTNNYDSHAAENLRQACTGHFKRFASSGFVANDLTSFVQKLTTKEFENFRVETAALIQSTYAMESVQSTSDQVEAAQLRWISSSINALKLDLDRMTSSDSQNISTTLLTALICDCIRLYRTSLKYTTALPHTDTNPGDEACVLAVYGLRALWQRTSDRRYIVQAAVLLEFLLADSKHNYKARIMLVSILHYLGLHSAAAKAYFGLKVKGIVCESICPILFTRLATFCPSFPDAAQLAKHLEVALDFYNQAVDRLPEFEVMAVRQENYAQVLEFNQLRSVLHHSTTRELLIFHCRRVARLNASVSAANGIKIGWFGLGLALRTASRLFDKQISNPVAEQFYARLQHLPDELSQSVPKTQEPFMATGPSLNADHINWLRLVDLILSMVYHPQFATAEHAAALEQLSPKGALADQNAALTSAERDMLPVLRAMVTLADHINAGQAAALIDVRRFLDDLTEAISNLTQSCTQTLQASPAPERSDLFPGWDVHQHLVLGLEALQACHKLVGRVVVFSKTTKSTKTERDGCMATANALALKIADAVTSLHTSARSILARLEQEMKSNYVTTNVLGDFDENATQSKKHGPVETIGYEIYRLLGSSIDTKNMTEDDIRKNGRLEARRLLQTMGESARHSIRAILSIRIA